MEDTRLYRSNWWTNSKMSGNKYLYFEELKNAKRSYRNSYSWNQAEVEQLLNGQWVSVDTSGWVSRRTK